MKRESFRGRIATLLLVSLLVPLQASAFDSSFQMTREPSSPYFFAQPSVAPSTGVFTHSVQIVTPAGRGGIQPSIALTYTSTREREGSLFGHGWNINIPYIERVNKHGTDKLFNQEKAKTYFFSSLSGELAPLTSSSTSLGSVLGSFLSVSPLPVFHEGAGILPILNEQSILENLQTTGDALPSSSPLESATEFPVVPEEDLNPLPPAVSAILANEVATSSVAEQVLTPSGVAFAGVGMSSSSHPIADLLVNLAPDEKANRKGRAIAELGSVAKTRKDEYFVEVISLDPIDNGVQVFARSWDANSQPIGFGVDGTVEIERFRIINPPILVDDPEGSIIRSWTDQNTGRTQERHLRESLQDALLESLVHTIRVVGRDGTKIVPGRIGSTTSTFYPAAGTGGSSVDGITYRDADNETFGSIRSGNGTHSGSTANNGPVAYLQAGDLSNKYYNLRRGIFVFDTSSIPDSDDISAATFSLCGTAQSSGLGTAALHVAAATTSSNSSIGTSDYQNRGTTSFGSTTNLGCYNDISLNAAGIANISKVSPSTANTLSKFSTQLSWDILNDSTGLTWSYPNYSYYYAYLADEAGTTRDPNLIVQHSHGEPLAPTELLVNGLINPSIATSSPYFSAIHNNASTTVLAVSYQIQVDSSGTFSSPYWDSGKMTLSSSTPQGQRSPNIFATTTFALNGETYYWRIKFWNDANSEGEWSTSIAKFTMRPDHSGDYASRVDDGSMMRYTFNADGSWTAYDKRGIMYRFGHSSSTQLFNVSTSSEIFRWYLEEVRDPHGNSMTYTYATTSVASGATSQVYPNKITYTSNGAVAGIYEVEFLREDRPDVATSSFAGFSVVTNQRIKEILVRANGLLTRRYQLSFGSGDNAKRSILATMSESGWDASSGTTTLPSVSLEYSKSVGTWSVQGTSTWNLPSIFTSSNHDQGFRDVDVNGDGLTDFIKGFDGSRTVWINNGSDWVASSSWTLPIDLVTSAEDLGVRIVDVNGDMLPDLVRRWVQNATDVNQVYLNNGTSTWVLSSAWQVPRMFIYNGNEYGTRVVDINGDGFADVLQSVSGTRSVHLNTGHGWEEDATWSIPIDFTINSSQDNGVRFVDVNGDGLVDLVQSVYPSTSNVYINNGHGWVLDASRSVPEYFVGSTGLDLGVRFGDMNGDGLVDLLRMQAQDPSASINRVYLNTGSSWSLTGWEIPVPFTKVNNDDYGGRVMEIDGDGMMEFVRGEYPSVQVASLSNGAKADFLSKISNEKGGVISVVYQSTPLYVSGGVSQNPRLPLQLDTVKEMVYDPGFGGLIATTTYSYGGGEWYFSVATPTDRQFSGFASMVRQNNSRDTVRTYFHQGNSSDSSNGEYSDQFAKIGKPYRIETLDGTTTSASLFSRTINKWARAAYDDGRNFVKLIRSLKQTFDGDASHRDTAEEMVYDDQTGNVSTLTNWGEVMGNSDGTFSDTGSDKAMTTNSYAASSTNVTMSLPSRSLVVDQSGNTARDTKWYYDNLALGSVTTGNQTKEEKLVSGSIYASTTKTYNAYGLPIEFRDPLGNPTTYAYDAFSLYPATTTNALGHATAFAHDYSSGKVTTTTDSNSRTFVTVYDGLDRPIEEKQPDFISPTTLVLKTGYTYTQSTSSPWSILRTDYLTSAMSTDFYTYLDGLGRNLQTRKEAESANGYTVRDWRYNNIGSLDQETVPYFSSGSSRTTATSATHLYTTYRYDPVGRVTTVADAIGTTTNSYIDWRLTITDALSNTKDLNKDAYGNLASVVEHLYATSSATTTYAWNLLGKLTSMTDALANVRNFSYDNLGRLTGSEDLHTSGDSIFGTTSLQYDLAGNLIQLYSPNGNTLNYTYDVLNRRLTEDATSTPWTDFVMRYDACPNGKGRLCIATEGEYATTSYSYNPAGLQSSETRVIKTRAGGTTWTVTGTTTWGYNRNGSVSTLTQPDGSVVTNTYDSAGLLESIYDSTQGKNAISSITYSPLEQMVGLVYGNGANSTSTYDQTKKYRLASKITRFGSNPRYQDLTYTYDAVGNITRLDDQASSTARKTIDYVYDNLYRLTSASTTKVSTTTSQYKETYTYDALGNLLTKSLNYATSSYTYAGTSFANPDAATGIGGLALTYDHAGNTLSAGSVNYAWNPWNRLSTTTNGATITTSSYDHNGDRVIYVDTSTTTRVFSKMYESTINSYRKRKTIYANGVAVEVVEQTGSGGGYTPYYIHSDHLGGTNVTSNISGALRESIDYYPYGSIRTDTLNGAAYSAPTKFIGEKYDTDSQLSFLNARYYDGRNGKFTSQDPMFTGDPNGQNLFNPQSLNSYSYAENNPIVKKDPEGKYAESAFDAAMFAMSVSQYRQDPGFINGLGVVLDGAAIAAPVFPAVGGVAVRYLGKEAGEIAQVTKNLYQGLRREREVYDGLKTANPGATILKQPYLRDASGKIVRDAETGEARRIDFAVVQNGQVTQRLEVTSMNAPKGPTNPQQIKEQSIIDNGGTYLRMPDGSLVNFANKSGPTAPATVTRKPRRRKKAMARKRELQPLDPKYVLVDWRQMLVHYRTNVNPPLTVIEIEELKYAWFLFYKFFQDNGLTTRVLVNAPDDLEGLIIHAGDRTAEGEKIWRFNRAEQRYGDALGRGTTPEKAVKNILERDLKKLRGA